MTQELRTIIWLAVVGSLLILGFRFLFPVFAPFLIGLLLACWIDPLVTRFEARFRIQRGFIIGVLLMSLTLLILAAVVLTVLALYQGAIELLPKMPLLINQLNHFFAHWVQVLPQFVVFFQPDIKNFQVIPESFNHILRSFMLWIMQLLPALPQIFFAVALGGITAFFLSRDKTRITRWFYRVLPPQWLPVVAELKHDMLDTMARYLRTELTLATITGFLTALALKFIGIPGVFTYAVLAGILDLIPVIGPGFVFFPLFFIDLIFGLYPRAVAFLVAYSLIVLIRQLLEVRFVGGNLNIHPLLALLIMYLGMKLYGFAGIFYAPAILIVLRSVYRTVSVNPKIIVTENSTKFFFNPTK
ncbi:sporulation integral membrane protein YtvI [Hydrogenispora ethanolica]|uniref:Sporulation integral membrane protein YtvI n=1 Tax=Hydrogenispora ethanolica TaxID=1082276 RepID=A0A4R1RSQ3_HYDET|nr:AI-2E family transporter [Hydrogenispora ethanolica]TCL69416.1 sporulation integral membrane protein YtvI [Hydrogenispora ethanolica]